MITASGQTTHPANPNQPQTMPTYAITQELLLFLVSNLSTDAETITAQVINRSDVFDSNDELGDIWDMLHFTTQDELAADVDSVLSGITQDLAFLI
jgi:hypothetical protein